MTAVFDQDTRELAETYDRVSDRQFESGKSLAERIGIGPGLRILDLGCGTGRLARWLAGRVGDGGSVVGMDPSIDRVEVARSRGAAVRYEVGRAEDLSAFGDGAFDAVCMSSMLHWVADKPRAMAEVRRVLRPGGRVGATTMCHELAGAGTIAKAVQPLFARAPYAGHVDLSTLAFAKRGYTTTDLITLVTDAGLELDELHVVQRAHTHASGEDLVQFIEASFSGSFLRIVPPELREELRADLARALDACRSADGIRVRDWGVVFVASSG